MTNSTLGQTDHVSGQYRIYAALLAMTNTHKYSKQEHYEQDRKTR